MKSVVLGAAVGGSVFICDFQKRGLSNRPSVTYVRNRREKGGPIVLTSHTQHQLLRATLAGTATGEPLLPRRRLRRQLLPRHLRRRRCLRDAAWRALRSHPVSCQLPAVSFQP